MYPGFARSLFQTHVLDAADQVYAIADVQPDVLALAIATHLPVHHGGLPAVAGEKLHRNTGKQLTGLWAVFHRDAGSRRSQCRGDVAHVPGP